MPTVKAGLSQCQGYANYASPPPTASTSTSSKINTDYPERMMAAPQRLAAGSLL